MHFVAKIISIVVVAALVPEIELGETHWVTLFVAYLPIGCLVGLGCSAVIESIEELFPALKDSD